MSARPPLPALTAARGHCCVYTNPCRLPLLPTCLLPHLAAPAAGDMSPSDLAKVLWPAQFNLSLAERACSDASSNDTCPTTCHDYLAQVGGWWVDGGMHCMGVAGSHHV